MASKKNKILLGWREWVALPALGIARIKVKVDTGARTSALHTESMEEYEEDGVRKVRFTLLAPGSRGKKQIQCVADVVESRKVTNSGGQRENRIVIETSIVIGSSQRKIEITLTDRTLMRFDMLLGRTAIRRKYNVNPGRSYLAGEPMADAAKKRI